MFLALKKTAPTLDDFLYMALIHAPQSRWFFVSMRIDATLSVVVYCFGLIALAAYILMGLKKKLSRQR